MKFLTLVCLLLTISSFQVSAQNKQDLTDYVTAVFAYLKLPQPTQLISCFDDNRAYQFFSWIEAFYAAEVAMTYGDLSDYMSLKLSSFSLTLCLMISTAPLPLRISLIF